MIWQKFLSYLNVFSRENRTRNVNLKMMHGVNRISILIFLVAVIIMIIRAITKH